MNVEVGVVINSKQVSIKDHQEIWFLVCTAFSPLGLVSH